MHRKILTLAAGLLGAAVTFPAAAEDNSALFILDGSGSMWGRLSDGQPKIASAKTVLGDLLRGVPDTVSVGLMAYGHRRKGDCADIEMVQAYSRGGAGAADLLARRITPRGKTPISQSMLRTSLNARLSGRRPSFKTHLRKMPSCMFSQILPTSASFSSSSA